MRNLKPFTDLTDDEIGALQSEDIEWYKQRTALEEGIVLAPDPGPEPEEPRIERDANLYAVGGMALSIGGSDALFICQEDVFEITNMIRNLIAQKSIYVEKYSYEHGYGNKYTGIPELRDITCKSVQLFTPERFEENKAALRKFKVDKEEWDKLNQAYRKFIRETEAVTEFIAQRCSKVQEKQLAMNGLAAAWKQYANLSEEQSALTFFAHAYKDKLAEYGYTATQVRNHCNPNDQIPSQE